MSIELAPESVKHKAGVCPSCRGYIWADVTLVTTVSPAALTVEGKTSVHASARVVAASIPAHECDVRGDDG